MIEHNRRGYSKFDANKLAKEHGGIVTIHKDLTIYKDGTVTSEEKGIGKMSDTGVVWEKNANETLKNIRQTAELSTCHDGLQPYYVTPDGRREYPSSRFSQCHDGLSPGFFTLEEIANRVREVHKEKPEGLFKHLEKRGKVNASS